MIPEHCRRDHADEVNIFTHSVNLGVLVHPEFNEELGGNKSEINLNVL